MSRPRYYEVYPTDITDDRLLARCMSLDDARRSARQAAEDEGRPVRIIECGDGWTEAVETVTPESEETDHDG